MKKEMNFESREEHFLKSITNMFLKNKDLAGLEVVTSFGRISLYRSNTNAPIGFSVSSDEYIESEESFDDYC